MSNVRYTPEFKDEAFSQVLRSGYPVLETAALVHEPASARRTSSVGRTDLPHGATVPGHRPHPGPPPARIHAAVRPPP